MATLLPPDPKKAMLQNLEVLRGYAKRVIVDGDDSMTHLKDVKDGLMQEVRNSGKTFKLTDRDVAVLLYKGVLPEC